MRTILNDPTWTFAAPMYQDGYNTNAARVNTGPQAQLEAEHKAKNHNYKVYAGVGTGANKLILYAVGEEQLAPLRKRYVGFAGQTPQAMMKFLREKVCLKLTTAEKERYKQEGYAQPWDPTKNITTYFKYLEDFKTKLKDRNINTTDKDMVMAAFARFF